MMAVVQSDTAIHYSKVTPKQICAGLHMEADCMAAVAVLRCD